MSRSPGYRNTTKKGVSASKSSTPSSSLPQQPLTNQLYFCHYRNAMYMGPVRHFRKDGRGVLLHDSGLSVLSSYSNDLLHGHNVFYAQHCLLSAQYVRGKLVQAVYRTDGFLVFLLFNSEQQLEGKCSLVDFTAKTLTYAVFRKGVLLEKSQETEVTLLNKVFDLTELEVVIGRKHQRAVSHEIEKTDHIQGQKHGNKLTVGFVKGGIMNGLSFSVLFRGSHGGYNPDTHRHEDEFQLRVLERGYMQNGLLHGFGQKLFKNGNLYVGEFKNGVFEGNGLLRNTSKRNWVSGFFQKGNLADLFEYNNEGGEKRYDKIIQGLHERKANWINNQVSLVSMDIFDELISKIMEDVPSVTVKTIEQRKQDVLRRIQENFLCEEQVTVPHIIKTAQHDLKLLDFEKQQSKGGTISTVKHFVQSFIPQASSLTMSKVEAQNKEPSVSMTGSKLSPQRRTNQDIRKSKIFDKSISTERKRIQDVSVSRSRTRTPEQKKKIFGQLSATAHKYRPRQPDVNSPQNETPLREETKPRNREEVEASSFLNVSEDDVSSSSRDQSRLKKSNVRSKIFHQDTDKSEESAPRFVYNRVDSIPEGERRRRIGLQENV